MPTNKEGHGVVLDEKGQEQPADKERAQTAPKSRPGRAVQHPVKDSSQH